jgi:predicted O-methyltransferase YrrM
MSKQWTVDDLMRLATGYQAACVVFAGAELDVFGALTARPMSAAALANDVRSDPRATAVLLDALVALGLLVKDGAEYAPAPGVADVLTETGSHTMLAMVRHQANCLRRWVRLPEIAKTGKLPEREPSILGAAADTASFIGAMDNVSRSMAAELIAEVRPLEFRHLLDVGGASGTWTIAFLRAVPGATATIFDLPDVIPIARRRIAEAGMADRVRLVGGDFCRDDLPAGADLAWLGAIIHQNSREQNRALFAKVLAALAPGGTVVIRDIVMDESRTVPAAGALFAINMLCGTPGGGTFSFREISEDLCAAGFDDVELLRRGQAMDSLVRARKK